MQGPYGKDVHLWSMATQRGWSLEDLYEWGNEKRFLCKEEGNQNIEKRRFRFLMRSNGITVKDLENVARGIAKYPPKLEADEATRNAIRVNTEESLLYYTTPVRDEDGEDPWKKREQYYNNPHPEVQMLPARPEEEAAVITYGRRGCKRTNDGEIKKKKKKAAAGAEMDDGVSTDEDDVPTPPLATAGDEQQMDDVLLCLSAAVFTWSCKRTNDGEIKKKKKDDGATVADKQAEG